MDATENNSIPGGASGETSAKREQLEKNTYLSRSESTCGSCGNSSDEERHQKASLQFKLMTLDYLNNKAADGGGSRTEQVLKVLKLLVDKQPDSFWFEKQYTVDAATHGTPPQSEPSRSPTPAADENLSDKDGSGSEKAKHKINAAKTTTLVDKKRTQIDTNSAAAEVGAALRRVKVADGNDDSSSMVHEFSLLELTAELFVCLLFILFICQTITFVICAVDSAIGATISSTKGKNLTGTAINFAAAPINSACAGINTDFDLFASLNMSANNATVGLPMFAVPDTLPKLTLSTESDRDWQQCVKTDGSPWLLSLLRAARWILLKYIAWYAICTVLALVTAFVLACVLTLLGKNRATCIGGCTSSNSVSMV